MKELIFIFSVVSLACMHAYFIAWKVNSENPRLFFFKNASEQMYKKLWHAFGWMVRLGIIATIYEPWSIDIKHIAYVLSFGILFGWFLYEEVLNFVRRKPFGYYSNEKGGSFERIVGRYYQIIRWVLTIMSALYIIFYLS